MKAILQTRYGDPEQVLFPGEIERPIPGEDDALVNHLPFRHHRPPARRREADGGVRDCHAATGWSVSGNGNYLRRQRRHRTKR